ncbi:MAG TPA: sulfotransferase [Candidatus Thermoplasmatota archaeon]
MANGDRASDWRTSPLNSEHRAMTERISGEVRDAGRAAEGIATPLFICGMARSGTTLLQRMLDGHPDLAVLPDETYAYALLMERRWSGLFVHVCEVLGIDGPKSVLAHPRMIPFAFVGRRARRRRLAQWAGAALPGNGGATRGVTDEIPVDFGSRGPWHPFLALYRQATGTNLAEKRYWVEKTPSNERFVPLTERFSDRRARYLHVVRDPRDVVASHLLRTSVSGRRRRGAIVHLCYTWASSVEAARTASRQCGERYVVVRYEEVVRHTRVVMAAVAERLGLPWDDRLLVPTERGAPAPINSSSGEQVAPRGAVDPDRIGGHRNVLEAAESAFVADALGEQMRSLGYDAGSPGKSEAPLRRKGTWRFRLRSALEMGAIRRLQARAPYPDEVAWRTVDGCEP